MKISLIIPEIDNPFILEDVLYKLKEQNNQDFEIILALKNNSKSIFKVFEKYLIFFGSRLKFILNTKKRTTQNDISIAFHLVKNDYVNILFPNTHIKKTFINDLDKLLNCEKEPDIIEFTPLFKGDVKWYVNSRIEENFYNNSELLKKYPFLLAYTFPIINNKLINKKLIQQFIKFKPSKANSSIFCLELVYFLMLKAKSYYFSNEIIFSQYVNLTNDLNINILLDQFNRLKEYIVVNDLKLTHEIEYAELYFIQIFLATLINLGKSETFYTWNKNKELKEFKKEKIYHQILSFIIKKQNTGLNFYNTNFYLNQNKIESKYLKSIPDDKNIHNLINVL
ncbi:hypothetical protein VBM87_01780 [Mycoplasma sp. 744]|uniref:hypothetical protein n=1 Tax=Mycoplasma sp. 744 TaxID=3108531 RepID=UPI002B1D5E6E|nr:hypothetical protein [Mycoplasma sp. 744]MEA4115510.1 hypothetical protein [Mycoplasma sp. 744]